MIKRITFFGLMFLSFAPPKLPTPNSSRDISSAAAAAADDSYASEEAAAADAYPASDTAAADIALIHHMQTRNYPTHSGKCSILDTYPGMKDTSKLLIPSGAVGSAILVGFFQKAMIPTLSQYGRVFDDELHDNILGRYEFEYMTAGLRLLANFLKQKTPEQQREYISRFNENQLGHILSAIYVTYLNVAPESLHAGDTFLLSYSAHIPELLGAISSIDLLSKFVSRSFDTQEDKIRFILDEVNPAIESKNPNEYDPDKIENYRAFAAQFDNRALREAWMKRERLIEQLLL